MPLWQEVFKDDRHVLLEGCASRPAAFIALVQDAHRDGASLVCLGLLHQSQHRVQGIKPHALTGAGDMAAQTTFDGVAL